MGVDVLNITDVSSLRDPVGRDPNGVPTVLLGLNYIGRAMRITIPIEKLSPYFNTGQESLFTTYYTLVNSFTKHLPYTDYWRHTDKKNKNQFSSTQDVIDLLLGEKK